MNIPEQLHDLGNRARSAYAAGDRQKTTSLCNAALDLDPLHAESIFLLGVIAIDEGKSGLALRLLHHAAALRPKDAGTLTALAEAWRMRKQFEHAQQHFLRAIEADASFVSAYNGLADMLFDNEDLDAAEQRLREAVAISPTYARAHMNLGRVLNARGDLDGAIASFQTAIDNNPNYAIAHNNLGGVYMAREQHARAIECFQKAIRVRPTYPEAHFNFGCCLIALGRPLEALERLNEAIRLRPNYARAHCQSGQALVDLGQVASAADAFKTASRINPKDDVAMLRLAEMLQLLSRMDEAKEVYDALLKLAPDNPLTIARITRFRLELCDWTDWSANAERLWQITQNEIASNGQPSVAPLHAMSMGWSADRQLALARAHSDRFAMQAKRAGAVLATPLAPKNGRIRIGYLSRDFYDHPVGHLIPGLFASHDRKRFEVYGYSFGPDDKSDYRRRIEAGCDQFIEMLPMSIEAMDRRIREDGIHILIDLMGHTGLARTGVLARRPAPVQVSWLGYAGTMGANFIDYIIGDHVVSPAEHAGQFTEQIIRLPDSYMATDDQQQLSPKPTRDAVGLPTQGIVFCCFNNSHKIGPEIFDVWMRLLDGTPGSVAWLNIREPIARQNIRHEATKRGIDPDRLIFADYVKSLPDHLARLQCADLFLDTPHYNAHATSANALRAGLPVITCLGDTFASRVAASLLTAVGLAETITPTLAEYERLTLDLAHNSERRSQLRSKFERASLASPLFNTRRFVTHLEQAYDTIWATHAKNQSLSAVGIAPS